MFSVSRNDSQFLNISITINTYATASYIIYSFVNRQYVINAQNCNFYFVIGTVFFDRKVLCIWVSKFRLFYLNGGSTISTSKIISYRHNSSQRYFVGLITKSGPYTKMFVLNSPANMLSLIKRTCSAFCCLLL